MSAITYNKLNKSRPRQYEYNNVLKVFCAAVCALAVLLTTIAFVVTWHLSIHNNVPDALMKSFYRANIYADYRKQKYSKSKPLVEKHEGPSEPTKIVSCYYNTPNPESSAQLQPADLHPHLCTHINVAFATIVNKQIHLEDIQYKAILEIVKLRKINRDLKILLSVGGAGNNSGFSDMVKDHASRKVFIKSIKAILRNYTLDGIDLDWEFPGMNLQENGSVDKRERQHFSQLLREIRSEYIREKRNYVLTVAVAAPETIVDISYDVDQLNLYTDYVNVMTYDFHSFTKFTPFTGLNSPLYPRSNEQLYLATLNINYTTQMYVNKGLDKSKIVIGIPTYGHTFTLVNPDNTMIGSPASGFGSLGGMGFVNYPDICLFVNKYKNVVIEQDPDAKVPYLFRGREWVSYDSPASVALKAEFARSRGLGGAMVYSLNADDYAGLCHRDAAAQSNFPLLRSVKNTLLGDNPLTK